MACGIALTVGGVSSPGPGDGLILRSGVPGGEDAILPNFDNELISGLLISVPLPIPGAKLALRPAVIPIGIGFKVTPPSDGNSKSGECGDSIPVPASTSATSFRPSLVLVAVPVVDVEVVVS